MTSEFEHVQVNPLPDNLDVSQATFVELIVVSTETYQTVRGVCAGDECDHGPSPAVSLRQLAHGGSKTVTRSFEDHTAGPPLTNNVTEQLTYARYLLSGAVAVGLTVHGAANARYLSVTDMSAYAYSGGVLSAVGWDTTVANRQSFVLVPDHLTSESNISRITADLNARPGILPGRIM